jgi:1,4-dihydroxy-2-naphthoate polyprenyltransferase
MSSMFLGACAAASLGPIDPFWLAATVAGIFLVEVGKNASGEVFDFATDAAVRKEDRSPFSGGKRVLVDGLLTRRQTWAIAVAGFGGGVAIGLYIAAVREPGILFIGLAGVGCAYFYNGRPLRLAYRGWGELAVGACYGPLIFAGTVLVQRHEVPWTLLAISLPLGLLIAAFLWVCEFPDYEADRSAGKRNLVVRLGRRRASLVFPLLFAAAAAVVAVANLLGAPRGIALGLIFLAPASIAAITLGRFPENTPRIIPAQAWTLMAFLAYSVGAGWGLLFVR